MEGNQKIGCKVCSCKHNCDGEFCDLDKICVCPVEGCHCEEPEESMCSSYENVNK